MSNDLLTTSIKRMLTEDNLKKFKIVLEDITSLQENINNGEYLNKEELLQLLEDAKTLL